MTTCVIHGSAWLRLGVCQACENEVEKHRAVPVSREVLAELQRDAARLDALQAMTKGYGNGWILRESVTGRGMRLHETSQIGAHPTVRAAIDAAMVRP